jgi:hypothetical protein
MAHYFGFEQQAYRDYFVRLLTGFGLRARCISPKNIRGNITEQQQTLFFVSVCIDLSEEQLTILSALNSAAPYWDCHLMVEDVPSNILPPAGVRYPEDDEY